MIYRCVRLFVLYDLSTMIYIFRQKKIDIFSQLDSFKKICVVVIFTVSLVFHCCFTAVFIGVSLLFHCCFIVVSLLFQLCFSCVSVVFQLCFSGVLVVFQLCFSGVSVCALHLLSQQCFSDVKLVFSVVFQLCFSSVSVLFH